MLLGSALILVYLTTGLTLALIVGSVLDSRIKLPGKIEREMLKTEKELFERGIDREMMMCLLVLMWPMILTVKKK